VATKKKTVTPPKPDLHAATCNILTRVATWMEEEASYQQLTGLPATNHKLPAADLAVLEEAKKLAINYIRMGAQQ